MRPHLDDLRMPGEVRAALSQEDRPRLENGLATAQNGGADEDRVPVDEGGKGYGVLVGDAGGEGDLGSAQAVGGLVGGQG